MIKRRHHYVWKKYLKSWSVDGCIWCLRDNEIFQSNPKNTGLENNFYEFKGLSSADIEFIEKEIIKPSSKKLQELNRGWLKQFGLLSEAIEIYEKNDYSDPLLETKLDELKHNFEEDIHSEIENNAIEYIDSILRQDISFCSSEKSYVNFLFYLCVQYMRTKKIKQGILKEFQDIKSINIENCWSVMRWILSQNMGYSLFLNRSRLVLVMNETPTYFITGDQPVINTYDADKNCDKNQDRLEFYYPVSPNIAILISNKEEYKNLSKISITEDKVIAFNNMTIYSSHEQIYAKSKDDLCQ